MTTYPNHERLKMELRLRGSSLTQIAFAMGVHPGSVTAVSQGLRRSRRIERALAAAVDKTPAELFPGRYSEGER